jgi:hypothetical protein
MSLLTHANMPRRLQTPHAELAPRPRIGMLKTLGEFVLTMVVFTIVVAAIAALKIAVWLPSFNY